MPEFETYLLDSAADMDDVRHRLEADEAIILEGVAISVGTIGGQSAVSVEVGGRTFLAVAGASSGFVARDTNGALLDLTAEVGE